MKPLLGEFLACEELDQTLALREQLGRLEAEDHAAVNAILVRWDDTQAIANLMMHPGVIPPDQRFRHLLRGLSEASHPYIRLAAVVGVQRLGSGAFLDGRRRELVGKLVSMLDTAPTVVAQRASVTLVTMLAREEHGLLTRALEHPDETVRHNVLVAHVSVLGLQGTVDKLRDVLASDTSSAVGRAYLAEQVPEMVSLAGRGGTDSDEFILSSFSAPRLAYIPNLREWPVDVGRGDVPGK